MRSSVGREVGATESEGQSPAKSIPSPSPRRSGERAGVRGFASNSRAFSRRFSVQNDLSFSRTLTYSKTRPHSSYAKPAEVRRRFLQIETSCSTRDHAQTQKQLPLSHPMGEGRGEGFSSMLDVGCWMFGPTHPASVTSPPITCSSVPCSVRNNSAPSSSSASARP